MDGFQEMMCVCVFVMEKSLIEGNYFIQTRVRAKAVFVCSNVFTYVIQINTNLQGSENLAQYLQDSNNL